MRLQRPPTFRINRQSPLANGLVFAGLGGGASTNALVDSSLFGRNGTLTNMDPATDWVWDSTLNRFALDFDGTDDKVDLGARSFFAADFTVSCWCLPTASGAPRAVWAEYDDATDQWVRVQIGGAVNTISCTFDDDTTKRDFDVAVMSDASWSNLVIARQTTFYSYLNGVAGGTAATNGNCSAGDTFWLGGTGEGTTAEWIGKFADLMVWNRGLSVPEIQQLADPSNVMLSGLILPPRRKIWAVPAAAPPATFNAAWARNKNQLIGGGVS